MVLVVGGGGGDGGGDGCGRAHGRGRGRGRCRVPELAPAWIGLVAAKTTSHCIATVSFLL